MMFDSDQSRYVSAPFGDTGSGYAFGGKNQRGIPVADMLAQPLNTEGSGGRISKDGVDQWGFPWCPFGQASNIEFIENQYPFLQTHYRHWKDSCGHGKNRGGIGMQIGYMMHHVPRVNFLSIAANSRLHTGQGLFGGYPARVIPGLTFTDTDLKEKMERGDEDVPESLVEWVRDRPTEGKYNVIHHARKAQPYNNGDVFGGFSSGGNGYGDAIERDPEAIMEDLRRQRITDWSAKNVYHVEYDEDSRTYDEETTADARREYVQDRLAESVPWDEFINEWEDRQPPEEIMGNYGRWPDGEKEHKVMRM
jgi:acetophenone carboxylase